MSDATNNDVLMCLQHSSGYIPAESSAVIDSTDTMASADFKTGKFFEIQSFSVGMKLADSDRSGGDRTYEDWRSAEKAAAAAADGRVPLFNAEPEELTITRAIDLASPMLLQYCLNMEELIKAVIVKRRRNNLGKLTGFLKMEFTNVAIRLVEWSDGDTISETCKFQYKKLTVDYNIRKVDGSKGSAWNTKWDPMSNG